VRCLIWNRVTSLNAKEFGAWEERGFEPEGEFLKRVGSIEGVSEVETQNYIFSWSSRGRGSETHVELYLEHILDSRTKSTIKIVLREEIANLRCKHISSYYHFIRELHKSGIANIQYIHTKRTAATTSARSDKYL
jgi:hypothetical protein